LRAEAVIDKPLNQITYPDIDQFVREQGPEGKTVDYKRDPYAPVPRRAIIYLPTR
jgi:hypothetical protein